MKQALTYPCKMLLLLLFFSIMAVHGAMAQQMTVTGTVSDTKNQTIPAVSVQIKGTQTGAVADVNGKYTIKATTGQVLTFQSVGYDAKEVTVGSSSQINVTLT